MVCFFTMIASRKWGDLCFVLLFVVHLFNYRGMQNYLIMLTTNSLTSIIKTFHSFSRGLYISDALYYFLFWNKICNHVLHVSRTPPFAETCDHLPISRQHQNFLNQCILSTLLLLETILTAWFKFFMVSRVFPGTLDNSRVLCLHVQKLIWYRPYIFCCACPYFVFNLTFYCWSFSFNVLRLSVDATWLVLHGLSAIFVWLPRDRSGQNAGKISARCVVCLFLVHVLILNLIWLFILDPSLLMS